MALNPKYIERLGRRSQRKNGWAQLRAGDAPPEKASAYGLGDHARSLLVVGSPLSQKDSWRTDARWLEENCQELAASEPKPSEPECSAGAVASLPTTPLHVEQTPARAPQCPPLESGFWQQLLYGSSDALIPGPDTTRAIREIGERLGVVITEGETLEASRAGALRKLFWGRFGAPEAERAMRELWRSAPATPGAPLPNEDQSHLAPGPWPLTRSQPRWIHDLHRQTSDEQRQLEELGGWCGCS